MRQTGGTRGRARRRAVAEVGRAIRTLRPDPRQALRGERIGAEPIRLVAAQAGRCSGCDGRSTPRSGVHGADGPGTGAGECDSARDGGVGGGARARCGGGAAGAPGSAMLSALSAGRIGLCTQPTDMRCSFDRIVGPGAAVVRTCRRGQARLPPDPHACGGRDLLALVPRAMPSSRAGAEEPAGQGIERRAGAPRRAGGLSRRPRGGHRHEPPGAGAVSDSSRETQAGCSLRARSAHSASASSRVCW